MAQNTSCETKPINDSKDVEKSLQKLSRMLVDNDEQQRGIALNALKSAHPTVARAMAERLVVKLQRGSESVRQRAHVALIAAGRPAVSAVAEVVPTARNTAFQHRLIEILLAIGRDLPEQDRSLLGSALLTLWAVTKEESTRRSAINALLSLKTGTDIRQGPG